MLNTEIMSPSAAIIIVIMATAIAWAINQFFKLINARITRRTKTDADDRIVKALQFPTIFTVITSALIYILTEYETTTETVLYLNNALTTLISLIWTFALVKILEALLDEIEHHFGQKLDGHDMLPFFKSVSTIGIILLGGVAILIIWDIDIRPLLAAGGVAGIAVAFAAKDTIANVFGGLSIFFDKPFKVGDYVIIDSANDERGEVVTIGARTTKIKTRDDILISIPNSIMSTSKIVNETGLSAPLRIRVEVGLPYGCDLEKAEKVLYKAICNTEGIRPEPDPRIRYRKFADSSINAEVMGWVEIPAEKGFVTHRAIKNIHKELRKAKITIPFPQRDVHMFKG